jgi:hypothetical protein
MPQARQIVAPDGHQGPESQDGGNKAVKMDFDTTIGKKSPLRMKIFVILEIPSSISVLEYPGRALLSPERMP